MTVSQSLNTFHLFYVISLPHEHLSIYYNHCSPKPSSLLIQLLPQLPKWFLVLLPSFSSYGYWNHFLEHKHATQLLQIVLVAFYHIWVRQKTESLHHLICLPRKLHFRPSYPISCVFPELWSHWSWSSSVMAGFILLMCLSVYCVLWL